MTAFLRLVAALWLCLAAPALAQTGQPATLVADRVFLDGKTRLIAEGRVEALTGETRISAGRIVYDRAADRLQITGPIRISQGESTTILASSAEMDPNFENAILRGARLVLDQQVQLAAYQMNRVNGRYSQLYKTAVTSCHICNAEEPPLWQIRARRVIHDQKEKQLYFEHAHLRVKDIPVFYLPYLRLPDPTLKRASGFLIPSFTSDSQLGLGLRLPYFVRLGDHRDVTFTPHITTKSRTLEVQYRQAFRRGDLKFNGAASRDDLQPGKTRGYLFGQGQFALENAFKLDLNLELVRDNTYLVDYGYSSKDRLRSEVALSRVTRDSYLNAALAHYKSLRVGEDNLTIPSVISDIEVERRHFPKALGGELRLSGAFHTHYRRSSLDTDSADADLITDGRDVARLNAKAEWIRDWTLRNGMQTQVRVGFAADQTFTSQDSTLPASASGLTPMAALALRWPLMKRTRSGARHILEPVVQLGWVGGTALNVANDESTRVEFDEGNLLSLSHFPAPDRRERGLSLGYGLSWTRTAPGGWDSNLTIGQVLRQDAQTGFSNTSGLSGRHSDLLIAGQLLTGKGLSVTGRAIFDTDFDVSKAEARASYQKERYGFGASYVWLGADPDEDRAATLAELSLDGLYRVNRHWTASGSMRYDVTADEAAGAELGLQYRNECVKVDLSVSRRFTSSTILKPSTSMSFTVGLLGFSAKTRDKSYARQCKD